jgi:hypothetical protein
MNRAFLSMAWILLAFSSLTAQYRGTDTLFQAGDLIYFSSLERKAIGDFLNGNPDYLAMIAAVNPGTNERELKLYRDWIDGIIAEIQGRKFDRLSHENKIGLIQKYISRFLLINYDSKANFDNLFRDGEYNYLTAAALYAFILEQLGIPCEIHESPTHIYLIAYPGDEKIRIETTKPGFGFFMFDYETRENFVDFIHSRGVIDDQTYKNVNTKDLFQQYYFADYGLTIREMVGMLYLNSAVEMMMEDRLDDSYAQLEKAFILYPCCKTLFLLLTSLNGHILNMDYHNLVQLGYLIRASRLVDHGVDRDLLENYLEDIVDKVLVEEEDPDGFKYIYEYLLNYLRDEGLKEDFTFHYLYERGKMEFLNARYEKALEYLESAYLLHPEDEATQDLLARSLGGYALMTSPGLLLDKINHYDTVFTGVTDEGVYLLVKMQTYLSLFGEAFQLQDQQTGERYMAVFEEMMDENPEAGIDQYFIGRSYSSAAIYYYRRGKLSKSKQVLEKGLSYAPGNIELKLKLSTFR